MLKQRYGTKIDSQVHDLQAMLSAQELEVRGVDAEFLKVWSDVSKVGRGQNSDWKRSALGRIFRYDIGRFLFEKSCFTGLTDLW